VGMAAITRDPVRRPPRVASAIHRAGTASKKKGAYHVVGALLLARASASAAAGAGDRRRWRRRRAMRAARAERLGFRRGYPTRLPFEAGRTGPRGHLATDRRWCG
jgi:hypothetical protein